MATQDFRLNVKYCLEYFHETSNADMELSDALEVNSSAVNRWKNLRVTPYRRNAARLARLVGVPIEWFYLLHEDFKKRIHERDPTQPIFKDFSRLTRRVVLGAIEKWSWKLDECFDRHVGSYFMYSRLLSQPTGAAISLLRVKEKTDHGITFDLYNLDTRQPEPADYYYRGLVFPISECLSFYGEEKSLDEPLSMITSTAQVPTKSLLLGNFIAIGNHAGVRNPNGKKVVLEYRSSKMLEFEHYKSRLGIVDDFKSLPTAIKLLI